MPNTHFHFKQFTIYQDRCAMKVCTDACLFGAWVADKVLKQQVAASAVADIGAGTGLLSLMMAQTLVPAAITAIEIDGEAAQQAQHNCDCSAWGHKLQVLKADVKELSLPAAYDLVISNPPFFEHDLISPDAARNLALHSTALTLGQLVVQASLLLNSHGTFAVLLPYNRAGYVQDIALQNGLYLQEMTGVQQTEQHPLFRAMLLFGKTKTTPTHGRMCIKTGGEYSAIFTSLLQPYYLYL